MPLLSLAHLEMLSMIRACASLREAAERLSVTQSALSHRIREAERRLGVALFVKAGRGVRPTAAAEILTDTADRMLDRLEMAERAAAASSAGVRHVVRITVCDYNTYHWLPAFLGNFRATHPEIEIEIEPNGRLGAMRRLADGGIDLAIFPDAPGGGSLDGQTLFADELAVVVRAGHPLAAAPFVAAADLIGETYLTYSLLSRPGFENERLWLSDGAMPLHKRNLGSVDAVCELVKTGAGISILSRWGLTREIEAGSLIALRAGRDGLPIVWRAVTAGLPPPDGPVHGVVDSLADWFGTQNY